MSTAAASGATATTGGKFGNSVEFPYVIKRGFNGMHQPVAFKKSFITGLESMATPEEIRAWEAYQEVCLKSLEASPSPPVAATPATPKQGGKK